jgi:phage shock protein C
MESKRLYRNRTDKVIAGVASGLGDYFLMDPILIRLLFVILTLAGGGGVLIYIIMWIVTPEKPLILQEPLKQEPMETQPYPTSDPKNPGMPQQKKKGSLVGGLVLITLGVLFLADSFFENVDFGDLWPLLLVAIGVGLLVGALTRKRNDQGNQG